MLEPRSCLIGEEQWKVVDNEVVIIRATGLIGKSIIFELESEVRLSRILRDIGRWSIPWRKRSVEDVSAEGLRPR